MSFKRAQLWLTLGDHFKRKTKEQLHGDQTKYKIDQSNKIHIVHQLEPNISKERLGSGLVLAERQSVNPEKTLKYLQPVPIVRPVTWWYLQDPHVRLLLLLKVFTFMLLNSL